MLRKKVNLLLEELQVCIFAEIVFGVRCTLRFCDTVHCLVQFDSPLLIIYVARNLHDILHGVTALLREILSFNTDSVIILTIVIVMF